MTVWNWRIVFLVVLFVSLFSVPGGAGELLPGTAVEGKAPLFREANEYFRRANDLYAADPAAARDFYLKAVRRFERLTNEGGVVNGKLYYNIGNCYFLLDDIGRAILNYRRAERYIPADVNLRQNLAYVLSKRLDRLEIEQRQRVMKTLFFWHYDLTTRIRSFIFGFFYVSFWSLAAVRLFYRRSALTRGLAVSFCVALLFFGSLAVDHYAAAAGGQGVLLASEVTARKGDGVTYSPSFKNPLHAGTEFTLLEKRGNWWHIELVDGRQCWVPGQEAALVR